MAPDDEPPPPPDRDRSADEQPDRTVKDLLATAASAASGEDIDEATARDLERWFGLPSFQQLAEQPAAGAPEPEDDDARERRERRDRAIAAVSPDMLARIAARTEHAGDALIKFRAAIELRVDPAFACIDLDRAESGGSIAEPREVEIPDALRDDLHECTPQALLRDLHRSEREFDKTFDVVDIAAEQRIDIVAEVATAMATRWDLPTLDVLPGVESRAIYAGLRAERAQSWPDIVASVRRTGGES